MERFADPDGSARPRPRPSPAALARYRIATAAQIVNLGEETRADPGLMALLKIPDAAQIDPDKVWRPRTPRERLRVPIGITPDGTPVETGHQGVRRERHGPARIVHRRNRFR